MPHYFCLDSIFRQEQGEGQGVMKMSAAYALGIDSKLAVSRASIARKACVDSNEVEWKDISRLASCR